MFATLSSLLQPSIGKIMAKADISLCANNMKRLGTCIEMYTSDHDNFFPQQRHHSWTEQYSWDDGLAEYDGRGGQIENLGLMIEIADKVDNSMYQCPSDEIPDDPNERAWRLVLERKSYSLTGGTSNFSLNGKRDWYPGLCSFTDISSNNTEAPWSASINMVNRPSSVIQLAEQWISTNRMGTGAGSWLRMSEMPTGLRHNNEMEENYLFADQHVKLQHHIETLEGKTGNKALGTQWDFLR